MMSYMAWCDMLISIHSKNYIIFVYILYMHVCVPVFVYLANFGLPLVDALNLEVSLPFKVLSARYRCMLKKLVEWK